MPNTKTVKVAHLDTEAAYQMPKPYDNSKPTLVLVNSFTTSSELYRSQYANKELTDAMNLISIELLGHGQTRTRSENFTYWDTAIMNLQVLDALKITGKIFVLGTSQGGWITTRMAVLAPDKIAGIIPLGTSMDYESARTRDLGCWNGPEDLAPNIKLWSSTIATPDFEPKEDYCNFLIDIGFGKDCPKEARDFWVKEIQANYQGDEGRRRIRMAAINLAERDGLHHRLFDVKCPVLWLHGTADPVYTVANAKHELEMFVNAPFKDLKVVEGGQHFLSFSHPEVVDKALIEFVGLNNASQLQSSPSKHLSKFVPYETQPQPQEDGKILLAGWSNTILITTTQIKSQGFQNLHQDISDLSTEDERIAALYSAIGNHNGLLACLTNTGALLTAEPDPRYNQTSHLKNLTTESSPHLSHLALATNDRVAVTFKQAPNGNLCHVLEFNTFDNFVAWYDDPSAEQSRPASHHMLPGRPKQLSAGAATFLLLMESGEVYSWGDSRYRSLGRAVAGGGEVATVPADTPGPIYALGGLDVEKIVCGGWLSAALCRDGGGYLWGSARPSGGEHEIACLREVSSAAELALIDFHDDDGEATDVVDVAVGTAHVVVVLKEASGQSRVSVAGNNEDGQLGIDSDTKFTEDWTEVSELSGQAIGQVVCGPRSTYITTSSPS
ncbi:hypothetical protein LTR86_007353 [Recurvomyces mirabilis]|nr:hypothetical protein LTR86_007353 [Recurvomyces mirabilis]